MEQNLLKGKRVLIVDDEDDIRQTVAELLEGCEVIEASSFDEARLLLETSELDIAILDIMGVEGYQLLDIANRRGILAVILTARALEPKDVVRSYRGGAASFLPKEKMGEITVFLRDVLEANEKGRDPWWRWMSRLASFWKSDFKKELREQDEEFWQKLRGLH